MDTLLRYIQVRAFGRGLRGYHSAWVVVGVAIWMIHRARNADDVVYRTPLTNGLLSVSMHLAWPASAVVRPRTHSGSGPTASTCRSAGPVPKPWRRSSKPRSEPLLTVWTPSRPLAQAPPRCNSR